MFDKWFGFFVKVIWLVLFISLGIYLYQEYHKNTFYLKDFKVPVAWEDQGYSGEVVKEAILDEIDKVNQELALQIGLSINDRNLKSTRNSDNDNTQILSEINVEGFNLRVIVKAILNFFGKKDKNIGGYVTLTDSLQTITVQITDQTVKEFSADKSHPIKNLVHDAALYIMLVRQPYSLLQYYNMRGDTIALKKTYDYLKRHRDVIKDNDFYFLACNVSLIERDFDKADSWADSLLQKYPDDMNSYWSKSNVSFNRLRFNKSDSLQKIKYNKIYVENLKKCIVHNTVDGEKVSLSNVYLQLARYYFNQKNIRLAEQYVAKSRAIKPFGGFENNALCYSYIDAKNYIKAEQFIKKAINIEPDNANYWDSLAEVYALQGKDSLCVATLKKALDSPIKIGTVSTKAYEKDPRWQNLQNRRDFSALLKRNAETVSP